MNCNAGDAVYGPDKATLDDQPDDAVVFTTYDKDYGIVPEPRPSTDFQPVWMDDSVPDSIRNAINEGWINRTPAQVAMNTLDTDCDCDECSEPARWDSNFDRETVTTHSDDQMEGLHIPIRIIKFHCYWTVHVPDGYSALLTEPLGRPQTLFSPFSGCIDFDTFPTVTHAPTLFEEKTHTVIPEGTPLLQIIPFKRDDMLKTGVVRDASPEEIAELEAQTQESPQDRRATSVEIE